MTRTAQGAGRKIILMPAMLPEGQGARGQASCLAATRLPYPLPRGPVVEGHGLATGVALGFAARSLGGPAALQGLRRCWDSWVV